ncbi:MAG: HAMP domain-containing protein [Armatimonadetes bacterium]|nr:HAMP domain-containing protein [Armatimonadota bacterium]
MRNSFRARLALFSVGVSGLVLLVFAVSVWQFSQRLGLRQLDQQMAEMLGPILAVPHAPEHWSWIATGVNMRFASEGGGGCLMLVKGMGGRILLQSENWPDELAPASFPDPDPRGPELYLPPMPAAPSGGAKGAGKGAQAPAPPQGPQAAWRFLRMTLPRFETRRLEGSNWRLCVEQNEQVTFVLGVSLARLEAEMARIGYAFVAALPLALLIIGAGSWMGSGRALRSVEELARAAESVNASSLDQRLAPEAVEREFRRLVTVFNSMLDRLERSFSQALRFSADAAHEFRTPLTVLQGQIEQALMRAPAGSEEQELYGDLLDEVQRLKAIAQKLLLLSQADSGQLQPTLEPVDLSDIIEETVEDTQVLAADLAVHARVAPGVRVMADRDLLRQALTNLASNATKYNREGGEIVFELAARDGWAELDMSNTGPGIPPEDQERLFERFYRADRARSRRTEGAGLGLSLAREIIRVHGGDLVLLGSGDDRTTFRMTLPLAESSAPPPGDGRSSMPGPV